MNITRTHRRLILLIALGIGVAALSVTFSGRFLRGSLQDDIALENGVKTLVDADVDGTMTAREMRHGIGATASAFGTADAGFDLDGNGTVAKPDLREFVRILRSFRSATCGNGTREAGEECDELPGPANEVQMINYNGTIAINWIVEFNGETTDPIPPDATGQEVQAALEDKIGEGNVLVDKLSDITFDFHQYRVTFIGAKGGVNQPQMTQVQGPISVSTPQQGGVIVPSSTCSNQCTVLP